MSILNRILNPFKRRQKTIMLGEVEVPTFRVKDLHKIITTCPNGSRILINDRIWIQVNHLEVPE